MENFGNAAENTCSIILMRPPAITAATATSVSARENSLMLPRFHARSCRPSSLQEKLTGATTSSPSSEAQNHRAYYLGMHQSRHLATVRLLAQVPGKN